MSPDRAVARLECRWRGYFGGYKARVTLARSAAGRARVLPWIWAVGLVACGSAWVPGQASAETFDVGSPCEADQDCAQYDHAPWCAPSGLCASCTDNADCEDADATCQAGACVVSCRDALDCSATQPICDAASGTCQMCVADTDCSATEYCFHNWCAPDVCTEGQQRCSNDRVQVCGANGGTWVLVQMCQDGQVCEPGDEPACVESPGSETASTSVDGGGSEAVVSSTGVDASSEGGATTSGAPANNDEAAATGCRVGTSSSDAPPLFLLLIAFGRRRFGRLPARA